MGMTASSDEQVEEKFVYRPLQRHKAKFLLVGDQGVGKSSLLRRFPPDWPDKEAQFSEKSFIIGGILINAELWDVATGLVPSHLREADGVLLVYDVSNGSSFQNIADKWMPMIQQLGKVGLPCVLVSTKSDLSEQEKVVDAGKGLAWAKENGDLPFIETSAKAYLQVEEAFRTLAHIVASEQTGYREEE